MQEDLGHITSIACLPSHPASRDAFDDNDITSSAEAELAHACRESMATDALRSGSNVQGSSAAQNVGPPASYSYAAALLLIHNLLLGLPVPASRQLVVAEPLLLTRELLPVKMHLMVFHLALMSQRILWLHCQ